MIPKSLGKIGKAAKGFEIPAERKALEGDDWLPPEIGKFTAWPSDEASGEGEAVEDADEESDEEEEAPRAASDVRTIADLVAQLRQVTARLSAAEGGRAPAQPAGSWFSRFFGSSSRGPAAGGDQALASHRGESFGVGAMGGAVGAAAVFGLALLYGRRATR